MLRGELANEDTDLLQCFLGYGISAGADLLEEIIDRTLPVQKLPHVDAGRVQAKTMTGIGVEEYSPVVKLLPEYDESVDHGFFTVFQGVILPSVCSAMHVPGKRGYFVSTFVRCG